MSTFWIWGKGVWVDWCGGGFGATQLLLPPLLWEIGSLSRLVGAWYGWTDGGGDCPAALSHC